MDSSGAAYKDRSQPSHEMCSVLRPNAEGHFNLSAKQVSNMFTVLWAPSQAMSAFHNKKTFLSGTCKSRDVIHSWSSGAS